MDAWEYGGTVELHGRPANMWQQQVQVGGGQGSGTVGPAVSGFQGLRSRGCREEEGPLDAIAVEPSARDVSGTLACVSGGRGR